jgi:hypothetical protein
MFVQFTANDNRIGGKYSKWIAFWPIFSWKYEDK